jgi:hypothetical protein
MGRRPIHHRQPMTAAQRQRCRRARVKRQLVALSSGKWLFAAIVGCVALSVTHTSAQTLTRAQVNEAPVRVYGSVDQGWVVTAGDRIVIRDDDDMTVGILGVFEGEGGTYVLIAENCGGSSCGDLFQAIDMTKKPYVASPVFGTGLLGAKPEVKEGALVLTQAQADQQASFTYTFKDGQLITKKNIESVEPTGPVSPPGGDLAAFVNRKTMSEIFRQNATARPLLSLLGAEAFNDARGVALLDFGGTFAERYGVLVAAVCQPHDCGGHSISVVVDHSGHMWASLVRDGRRTFFGNPNPMIRARLEGK